MKPRGKGGCGQSGSASPRPLPLTKLIAACGWPRRVLRQSPSGAGSGAQSRREGDHPFCRYRIIGSSSSSSGAGRWPSFSGSAWRGAFGHALKRTVCVMHLRPCPGCPLEPPASTPRSSPPARRATRCGVTTIPHPYVLCPPFGPRRLAPGTAVTLGVTLVGRAARSEPTSCARSRMRQPPASGPTGWP